MSIITKLYWLRRPWNILLEPLYIWSFVLGYLSELFLSDWSAIAPATRMEWLKERWSLREDLFLSYMDSPQLRKIKCWFVRHDIKGARIAPVYDAPMEYWCEHCWMGDPVDYPEWGLGSYFHRFFVWLCDRSVKEGQSERLETVLVWFETKFGKRLPYWWEY